MAKGVALPINTIVILVLAVIVLIALVGMFIGRMLSSEQAMDLQKAWSTCCIQYCHTSDVEPGNYCCLSCDDPAKKKTIADLAVQIGKTTADPSRDDVLVACGCLTTTTSSVSSQMD